MQSKKFRYAALILALLMVLSFGLVMFAGCNEGEGEEKPGPGPSTGNEAAAAKLVTDESLKDKLFVLYDFEESNKDSMATLYGYDPYTGEPNERNGYYSSATAAQTAAISSLEDQVEGSTSATALNVASGITLNDALHGSFDGANVTNGVSVSFWAYNHEMSTTESVDGVGLAVDRFNIVTNGMSSMTWGTIYGYNTAGGNLNIYPSIGGTTNPVTVGRGAYTEESYAARRVLSNATDTLMREFDDSATDPYTGWNAIAGNIQTATDEDTYNVVYNIAHSYYQNWRYVTVSIQTDGVYFYTNGRLAYYYSAARIGTDWCSTTSPTADDLVWGPSGGTGVNLYYRFINALNATELTDLTGGVYDVEKLGHLFGMFGADACIYADDLILGYGLDADEACALYEDVSGVTYTADQLACTAAASEEDQAQSAEQNAAVTAYMAQQIESYRVEGDSWGTGADIGNPGPSGSDTNDDGKIDDVINSAKETFLASYDEGDYLAVYGTPTNITVGGYNQNGEGAYYIPEADDNGYFSMTLSGINLSRGEFNYQVTGASMYSGSTLAVAIAIDNRVNYTMTGLTVSFAGNITWVDTSTNGIYLPMLLRYCPMDIVFTYNSSALTITYNVYYLFCGQTVTLQTENYGNFEHTFTKAESLAQTITYTVKAAEGYTLSEVIDFSLLSLRLGHDSSAFLLQSIEGGSSSESAPAASN